MLEGSLPRERTSWGAANRGGARGLKGEKALGEPGPGGRRRGREGRKESELKLLSGEKVLGCVAGQGGKTGWRRKVGPRAWLGWGQGRGCSLSKEGPALVTQKETEAEYGETGQDCKGVGWHPGPTFQRSPVMLGGTLAQISDAPRSPREGVSSAYLLAISYLHPHPPEQNSLGWLRTPVPTLYGAG